VLLILVIANAFLHSDESPLNPMAAAAERTQSKPGAHFTMQATYSSAALPQPMTAHGGGAYNAETGLSEMTLKMDIPGKGPVSMAMVGDGTDVYMRGDEIAGKLPDGKEWLAVQPYAGHSEDEVTIGSGDADDSLQILGMVSDGVRQVGTETVRGVPTRRYRATLEMGEIVELYRAEGKDELADKVEEAATALSSPVAVEASIDAEGMVRRFRMAMTMPTGPNEPALTMDVQMDLFGFGARPEIALPDPSNVFDASDYADEQLD
jgi:hypothetical protein